MNNTRRKLLKEASELADKAKCLVEQAKEEEQECFDNLSDGLQLSERGRTLEENVYALDEIIDNLDSAIDLLGEL